MKLCMDSYFSPTELQLGNNVRWQLWTLKIAWNVSGILNSELNPAFNNVPAFVISYLTIDVHSTREKYPMVLSRYTHTANYRMALQNNYTWCNMACCNLLDFVYWSLLCLIKQSFALSGEAELQGTFQFTGDFCYYSRSVIVLGCFFWCGVFFLLLLVVVLVFSLFFFWCVCIILRPDIIVLLC